MKSLIFRSSLILLICILISCSNNISEKPPGRVINRTLSSEEMKLPLGRYHSDINSERSIKVDFQAPMEKPKVQWSRKLKHFNIGEMVIDNDGCLWVNHDNFESDKKFNRVSSYLSSNIGDEIIRLNPDGSTSWNKIFKYISTHVPVVVCKDAVITYDKHLKIYPPISDAVKADDLSIEDLMKQPREISLECFDLKGNTIWRTEPVETDIPLNQVWRISNDCLIMPVGNSDSGEFNIYDLSNGSLLQKVAFPQWYDYEKQLKPIELLNDRWIGFQKDSIVCYNSDLSIAWKRDVSSDELFSQPLILNGEAMIYSTSSLIVSLDLNDGQIAWDTGRHHLAYPCGVISDNSFSLISLGMEMHFPPLTREESGRFVIVNFNGKEELSLLGFEQEYVTGWQNIMQVISYNDETILIGSINKLTLIDKGGNIIWSMNYEELGLSEKPFSLKWNLFPAPNGRIVAGLETWEEDGGQNYYIISL